MENELGQNHSTLPTLIQVFERTLNDAVLTKL